MAKNRAPLDPYSTSQTTFDFGPPSSPLNCIYHAPYFAYATEGKHYAVTQGNCHHWDCPRCGVGRAKQEYWRIVQGASSLVEQGYPLYFLTITTRGKGLSVKDAEQSYLLWTNRLLTNLRTFAARHGLHWCYGQVTERQKRRHPHSHILTTFDPLDAVEGKKHGYRTGLDGVKVYGEQNVLRSERLQQAVISSGLGEQYDFTKVRNVEGVSRYVGKYLFKSSLLTVWPEGWRRVRYSQNWPKSGFQRNDAFPLLTRQDWYDLATCAETITCTDHKVYEEVKGKMTFYPVRVRERIAVRL